MSPGAGAPPPVVLLAGFVEQDAAACRVAIRRVVPHLDIQTAPSLAAFRTALTARPLDTAVVACLSAGWPEAEEALGLLRRDRPAALATLALAADHGATAERLCLYDDLVRLTGDDVVRFVVLVRRAIERADAERSRGDREALRRRRDELDRVARRYRGIAEHAEQAIVTFDQADRIEYVNPAMTALTGYAPRELLGRPCTDLFFEEDRPAATIRTALRKQGWRDKTQFRIRRKDGSEVWVEATGAPMFDADGHVMGRLSMVTDITERRADETRVRQALADREALLREVHHRVRNNFQIISSLFNLEFHDLEHPDLRGRIRDTQNRIATMALLHSLLYESDDLATARADLYLARIVDVVRRSYDQTGGRVTVTVDADPVGFCTDNGMRFGLIVNELVTNALKHAFPASRHGDVCVRLRLARGADGDDRVDLDVVDDGAGLPGAGGTRRGGHGLGLELVRDMVAQLDGTFAVESGSGTAVRMTFPAARVIH